MTTTTQTERATTFDTVTSISGAAGGERRLAVVNLRIEGRADTVEEVRQLAASAPDLLAALKALLCGGYYNDDGDYVLPHEPWDGKADPPDTSDNLRIVHADAIIARAEGRQ